MPNATLESSFPRCANRLFEEGERIAGAVRFSLFKVLSRHSRHISDMSQTEHPRVGRAGEDVDRPGFHLDGESTFGARRLNSFGRFAERRIGGPTRAYDGVQG